MTTYVNDTPWNRCGVWLYHLWADTFDELTFMASAVGSDAFQSSAGPFKHFYLTAEQRDVALAIGVTPTDQWGPVEWTAKATLAGSLDMNLWEWANKMLALVEARRAGR